MPDSPSAGPPAAGPHPSLPPDWREAIAPHLPRAHGVARRLLGCDHLAADAVQEALLAFLTLEALPPEPRGWLVRAVVFRCRHLRRSLRRRRRHEHHASAFCALHSGCDNPLHIAQAHELGERLATAIAGLPGPQRLVFRLHADSGLDYQGLAERLGWPLGTVRSRLHRARSRLQQVLETAELGHPPDRSG